MSSRPRLEPMRFWRGRHLYQIAPGHAGKALSVSATEGSPRRRWIGLEANSAQ